MEGVQGLFGWCENRSYLIKAYESFDEATKGLAEITTYHLKRDKIVNILIEEINIIPEYKMYRNLEKWSDDHPFGKIATICHSFHIKGM